MSLLDFHKKIRELSAFISSISLILMVVVVFTQTFTRFVIFYSLPWSEEASRYLFVVMIMMGFNVAICNKEMIRIGVIDDYISGTLKYVIDNVVLFISLLVSLIFTYSAYNLISLGFYQFSPAMQIPMSIMYVIIFVGFLLSLLSVIIDGYESFKGKNNPTLEEK